MNKIKKSFLVYFALLFCSPSVSVNDGIKVHQMAE